MRRTARVLSGLVLVLIATAAEAALIAPHALFLRHETRAGVFYVHNPSERPLEVDVELRFGYPANAPDGSVQIALFDELRPDDPSAAEWIRALPRRMVVPPGRRQAVRLMAQPPAGLPDGEYWSRIIVTTREQGQDATQPVEDAEGVAIGLQLATRTITSLVYRKGELRTGVQLKRFEAELENPEAARVALELERIGNAAYLGRMILELVDAEESVVWRRDRALAVYYALAPPVDLPFDELASGEYTLRLRLDTRRDDLNEGEALPAEPVEAELRFTWDGTQAR